MFILGNILEGIAVVLDMFLQIYMFIVFGRVIISWVDADPRNPIVKFLYRTTEPLFSRFRRWLPMLGNVGGLDLTPLVILGVIYLLQFAIVANIHQIARHLSH